MRFPFILAVALAALTGLGLVNWIMARSPLDVSPIIIETSALMLGEASPDGVPVHREIKLFQADARPLFAPDRRPWTPPPIADIPTPSTLAEVLPITEIAVSAPAAPPPELALIGIQKTPKGAMALLADKTGAVPVWLKEGETYQDWHVGAITASTVQLAYGASTITLELYPPLTGGAAGP